MCSCARGSMCALIFMCGCMQGPYKYLFRPWAHVRVCVLECVCLCELWVKGLLEPYSLYKQKDRKLEMINKHII